jgi:DNA-binding transcriptional regulator YiaG
MKKIFVLVIVAVLLLGFSAGKLLDDKMKSLLQQIQLSEENAQNSIFSNCSGPTFYLPNLRNIKGMANGERVSTVETVGNYVKDFVSSKEFVKRYNEYRESQKPSPPEKPQSSDELKNQQREDLKKSIEDMKVTKSQMPADQQGMFDETIKTLKEQLKELDNPDNPMFSAEMDKMMQENYAQQLETYKKDLSDWEKKYPADNPNGMVKKWLEEFVATTKDVDFNAKTALDEKGRSLFVKQEYESKDYLWKICFRAGKETIESARKFAQAWLSELK